MVAVAVDIGCMRTLGEWGWAVSVFQNTNELLLTTLLYCFELTFVM